MIVKRNTKELDKKHILSGTLESLSENIVDGITGPMFYFALFGLPGAFAYRIVNTIDSIIMNMLPDFRIDDFIGDPDEDLTETYQDLLKYLT